MTWLDIFNGVLLQVVQVAAIFAIGYVMTLLKKRTDDARVLEALQMVEDGAKRAVTVTTQTFIDEIKKAGALTEDTARQAFDRAYAEVIMTVNEDALRIADKVTGDVHSYIRQLIEEQVHLQKEEKLYREV